MGAELIFKTVIDPEKNDTEAAIETQNKLNQMNQKFVEAASSNLFANVTGGITIEPVKNLTAITTEKKVIIVRATYPPTVPDPTTISLTTITMADTTSTGVGTTTTMADTTSTGAGTTTTMADTTSTGAGTTTSMADTTSTGAGTTTSIADTTSTGAGTTTTMADTTSTGADATNTTAPSSTSMLATSNTADETTLLTTTTAPAATTLISTTTASATTTIQQKLVRHWPLSNEKDKSGEISLEFNKKQKYSSDKNGVALEGFILNF